MAQLKGSWPKVTGLGQTQFMYGPFIDANSNWYVLNYMVDTPYGDDNRYEIWKSLTSGSSWSLIGTRQVDAYTYTMADVKQNDDMIVMISQYDQGNWTSYHIHSESWLMSSYVGAGGTADGWGLVAVSAQMNSGTSGGYDGHPITLFLRQDINNFAVYFTNATSGTYYDRPYFFRWNDGTVDASNVLLPSYPMSNYHYYPYGCGIDTSGSGLMFFRYTSGSTANYNMAWVKTDREFIVDTSGSGYFPWPSSPKGTYNHPQILKPTVIDGESVAAFYVPYTNTTLYTYTSGSFSSRTIANKAAYVHDYDYDVEQPVWLIALYPTSSTGSSRPYQYIRQYKTLATSGSTFWTNIQDSEVTGTLHRTLVGRNNKIYFWQNDTNYYRLFEVCDVPQLSGVDVTPASSASLKAASNFTSA